jgi:hypothetical protein
MKQLMNKEVPKSVEAVTAYHEVLSLHQFGGTEGNHKNLQSKIAHL